MQTGEQSSGQHTRKKAELGKEDKREGEAGTGGGGCGVGSGVGLGDGTEIGCGLWR